MIDCWLLMRCDPHSSRLVRLCGLIDQGGIIRDFYLYIVLGETVHLCRLSWYARIRHSLPVRYGPHKRHEVSGLRYPRVVDCVRVWSLGLLHNRSSALGYLGVPNNWTRAVGLYPSYRWIGGPPRSTRLSRQRVPTITSTPMKACGITSLIFSILWRKRAVS